MLFADVAWQWHGVEAGATNGAVAEKSVDRNAAFAPPLGKARILENRQHQAGIARAFDGDILDRGGNGGRGGERAARPEGLRGQIFESRTDRNIFKRRGRQIDAGVSPTSFA